MRSPRAYAVGLLDPAGGLQRPRRGKDALLLTLDYGSCVHRNYPPVGKHGGASNTAVLLSSYELGRDYARLISIYGNRYPAYGYRHGDGPRAISIPKASHRRAVAYGLSPMQQAELGT